VLEDEGVEEILGGLLLFGAKWLTASNWCLRPEDSRLKPRALHCKTE